MSAIDFVVRGDAGVTQRGSLGGSDGTSIITGAGQDVSLNLNRGDILSYVRQGQALQVTLVDGTVLTVEGFFTPEGEAVADLFISTNGTLAQAELVAGEGNLMFAQYVDADSFGKWSPDDDLYFVRGSDVQLAGVVPADEASASQLGGALLGGIAGIPALGAGAAALGGSLLLAGSGGGGGGDDGDVAGDGDTGGDDPDEPDTPDTTDNPDVDPPVVAINDGTESVGHIVNADDYEDGVTIGGTGTPNTSGTITVGDVTKDITTDDNGDWTADFTQEEVAGGEYQEDVTVTLTNDGGTTTSTDVLVVDTVASVTIETSTVEGNGEINFDEESNGFTLTGSVEANSTVTVTFDGNTYDAVVSGTSWSLDVAAGVIDQGEYDLNVSVNATDAYGNTASTSGVVAVDTVTSVTVDTSAVGNANGDNTLNAVEHAGGVELTGLAEAGASVVVTLGTASHTVTATSSGTWSTTFTSGEVPTGNLHTLPVTAVSTDLAGNTATANGTVTIDTEIDVTVTENAGGADSVVNAVERDGTFTFSGQTDANASVSVVFEGQTQVVNANSSGVWSANYTGVNLPDNAEGNATVTVTATDAAGNSDSATTTVAYDTWVNKLDFTGGKVEGDNVVNKAEASDGVTLTGVVEKGSTVSVAFGSVTQGASVNSAGAWTVDFSAAQMAAIASGQADAFDTKIVVTATDAAGNVRKIEEDVEVDLVAPDAADVIAVTTSEAGVISATVEDIDGNSAFDQFVNGADASTTVNLLGSLGDMHVFQAGDTIPDGSHLLVTNNDDAGNSTSTLVVLQDTSTLDLSSGALGDFNVAEINLETTNGVNLEITADQLRALSADSDSVIIHGDDNDSVTMAELNGVTASETQMIDGQSYSVYNLGDDTSVIIDDAIALNPVV